MASWFGYDKGDEMESKLGEQRDFCRLLLIPEAPTDLAWAQSADHTITTSSLASKHQEMFLPKEQVWTQKKYMIDTNTKQTKMKIHMPG